MKRPPTPQVTIYEVYNTASADIHIGTYAVLAERLQRAACRDITRHPRQTEAAHLHRCARAAYPLALRITIKATKEKK